VVFLPIQSEAGALKGGTEGTTYRSLGSPDVDNPLILIQSISLSSNMLSSQL